MTMKSICTIYRKAVSVMVLTMLMSMTAAQAANESVETIGSYTDGTPVQAKGVDFGKTIYHIVGSPNQEKLLVLFREKDPSTKEWMPKGEMGLYSLKSHKMEWTMPFNYSYRVVFGQKRIYACAKGRTIAYEIETGRKLWKDWSYLTRIDEKNDVLLGYETDEPGSSKIFIINMLTNKIIAKTKIPHDKCWGWNDVIQQDDSHIIVLANNLNRVNLQTGEQQTIETKTGVIDAGKAVLNGLLWMGAGMVPMGGPILQKGLFMPASVSRNATTALHSNICQNGSLYYFADSERLICFDSELKVLWSSNLPEKAGSHSTLLLRNDTLTLFNYGYGVTSTGKQKEVGQPFMAAYDARTGKNLFVNMLNIDQWDTQKFGELSRMLQDTAYVQQTDSSSVFQAVCSNGAGYPIETVNGTICMVDEHLAVHKVYTPSMVFRPLLQTEKGTFVYHSEPSPELWLISNDGCPEMKIPLPINKLTMAGKTLCILANSKLLLL